MITKKIVVQGLVQGIGFRPFVAKLCEQLHISGWVKNTDGIVTILATGEEDAIALLVEKLQSEAPTGAVVLDVQVTELKIAERQVTEPEESLERDVIVHPQGNQKQEHQKKGHQKQEHQKKEHQKKGHQKQEHENQVHQNQFSIVESEKNEGKKKENDSFPLLPADLATCKRCEEELHDEKNRRFRHPFISCTACGPRYSIIDEIPYDREHITMRDFEMCPACKQEYTQKGDIRRHAQTIACKDCGPTLTYKEYAVPLDNSMEQNNISEGTIKQRQIHKTKENKRIIEKQNEEALTYSVNHLKKGGILAVKDIGGYHLAASPFEEDTIRRLRNLKGREAKPFAVLFPSVESVAEYCELDEKEEVLLTSPSRPIVLLRKKKEGKKLHDLVCGSSPDIGAMLCCNPVQIMLAKALGPLIMTSANVSGELITIENEQMEEWLCKESMAILSHDRKIVTPLDDSIVRVVSGKQQTLRRARGYVPEPVPFPCDLEIFAAGGDLKSCFCYTGGKRAYLSQHLGDLVEESCFGEYETQKKRMEQLFGFHPQIFVCDKHPAYRSRSAVSGAEAELYANKKEAQAVNSEMLQSETSESRILYEIQHHKAHVASVLAEHNLKGKVLGFAFDGTGYGDDKTIWGSEVFVWNEKEMKRVAHLAPVLLIGGDEGAKNADTILYGYLCNLLVNLGKEDESLQEKQKKSWMKRLEKQDIFEKSRFDLVERAIKCKINCVQSTSMGRLFDAVSAFLDICHYNSYEGQAPIELENLAATTNSYVPLSFDMTVDNESGQLLLDATGLFVQMEEALSKGRSVATIARGFLYAVSDAIAAIAEKMNIEQIALSGGTFLNRILLEHVTAQLTEKGFFVYRNEQVPPGDGGICLGQAYLAAKKCEDK